MTSDALLPLRDQVAAHPVPGPLPPRILQAREGVEAAAGETAEEVGTSAGVVP